MKNIKFLRRNLILMHVKSLSILVDLNNISSNGDVAQ